MLTLVTIAPTALSYSAHTISFCNPLNRRGKRGGANTSNREANTDSGISIIAMQLGFARINASRITVGVDVIAMRDHFGGVVVSVLVGWGA